MRHDVVLPRLGDTGDRVTLLEWKAETGDAVVEGQPLAVFETDKVDAEIPAPVAGSVIEHRARVGDLLSTGDVVCVIEVAE